jgi:predicted AlkP superfamily phosphohydrolase/phosphomutase
MKNKVIAIGLDSVDPRFLNNWINLGYLPNLKKIQQDSFKATLINKETYQSETPWVSFLTGCFPEKTGYWTPIIYNCNTYNTQEIPTYNFKKYPQFYSLGENYKVAIFDPPLTRIASNVNGLQLIGWGPECHQCLTDSVPSNILEELTKKYGLHPKYEQSLISIETNNQENINSFEVSSCYDLQGLIKFKNNLLKAVKKRFAICQDILKRDNWDLFLTVVGETHFAIHLLWHLSQNHPLNYLKENLDQDLMLEVFQAIDQEIGNLLKQGDQNTTIVLFSVHGCMINVVDLPSMVFLPELLYRWNFPGKKALASLNKNDSISSSPSNFDHWKKRVWELTTDLGKQELDSPFKQQKNNDTLNWQPANWYKPLWHKMKAFCLPTYSDGYIRINLRGRDKYGMVSEDEYKTVCDQISTFLYNLQDDNSGELIVDKIISTRDNPLDNNPNLPSADLVIKWKEITPTTKVNSPELGLIGNVPYFRTGGHSNEGFLMIQGKNIKPNDNIIYGNIPDLSATILDLIGANIPDYLDGKSLL